MSIIINNTRVSNFEGAIRGMRNPLESWEKSDSIFGLDKIPEIEFIINDILLAENPDIEELSWSHIGSLADDKYYNGVLYESNGYGEYTFIGKKDMQLMQQLILAGPDHSKFMRQIFVSMDITAPLYWWKEMDTYKVGTVANSCSTMHKLATTPITKECFSFDEDLDNLECFPFPFFDTMLNTIDSCEMLRKKYLETKDIRHWRALIQLLPSSWNQTRTWTANYAVLRNIYHSRKNHKLSEWRDFCRKIEQLPYAKELICLEEKTNV